MLSSWFERGLGQIVAPDEKAKSASEEEREEEGFWQIVAPDPRQQTPDESRVPPPAFLSPVPGNNGQVQCVNCNQWTPVAPSTPSPRVVPSSETKMTTPENCSTTTTPLSTLDGLVLSAAKETAESMISPPNVADARNKVFRFCASTKPLTEKMYKRLARMLQNDASLASSRASRFGIVPDGYTPLMAAAAVNHVEAAEIILEKSPEAVHDVDLQGRTALHIAAESGWLKMVELLKKKHPEGPDAPVDLTGHTPLGRAVTSTHKAAKQNQSELQEKLFSPGDVSVCGRPTPAKTRSSKLDLQLSYGFADMPGFRVQMEDAISCHTWSGHALFGVCDGHGDNGRVSDFVASQVSPILQSLLAEGDNDITAVWTETCLTLDAQLKESGRKGGSTAVWALVTESIVVVANVGDSRCILVHKPEEETTKETVTVEQAMENLTLEDGKAEDREEIVNEEGAVGGDEKEDAEEKDGQGEAKDETPASSPTEAEAKVANEESTVAAEQEKVEYIVTPLSEDHKPNLEMERARIENSGLVVTSETFLDNGAEFTLHKVQLSEGDRLAVSRAFGDFEYKSNAELSATEQAVVATPEIRIHERSERDMYLVLACDGVWDVMSSHEVGDFVVKHVKDVAEEEAEGVLPKVGDLLVNECLRRGSTDNMSVMIVSFDKSKEDVVRRLDLTTE